jgi:hypothetical protein
MGHIKKFFKLIKCLDFMGNPMNFKIKKSDTYKTVFGGILSLLLYLCFLYFIYLFGQDFIFKKNPTGYTKTEFHEKGKEKLSLKNDTFFIALRLEDFNVNPLNFNDFPFIYFSYEEFNQTSKKSKLTKIPSVKCNTLKLPSNLNQGIFDLSSYICPDLSSLASLNIFGDWDTEITTLITVGMSICNQDQTICKDYNEINKRFEKELIILRILLPFVEYDITNVENPMVLKLKSTSSFLNSKRFILEEFYLSSYKLKDDKGVLMEDILEDNMIGISDTKSYFDFRDNLKDPKNAQSERDKFLFRGEIFYSNKFVSHNRNYLKILDIIGNVYGVSEIVAFIVMFFYSYYNSSRLDSFLCMRLLYLEEDDSVNFDGKATNYTASDRYIFRKKLQNFFYNKNKNKRNSYVFSDNDNYNDNYDRNDVDKFEKQKTKINKINNFDIKKTINDHQLLNKNISNTNKKKKKSIIDIENINNNYKINSKELLESDPEFKIEKFNYDTELNNIIEYKEKVEKYVEDNNKNNSKNVNDNNEDKKDYENDYQNKYINTINYTLINGNCSKEKIGFKENNKYTSKETIGIKETNTNANIETNGLRENIMIELRESNEEKIIEESEEENNENNKENDNDNVKLDENKDNENNHIIKKVKKKEIENEKENEEKYMIVILDYTLNKFRALKNSIKFTWIFYFWYYIFPNKKLTNNYEIIFKYSEKLQNRFDVFYYMHQHKKLNLIEGILFNPIEKKLMYLISKKYYRISLNEEEQSLNNDTQKEIEIQSNDELIKYVLNNKDSEFESKSEQLIRSLIK